jgi:NADP-dependent 3-hydroxy acid dehydrogenase YdfG
MENRVVAITGGNSGIGLAISELFLENGYKVAIFAQSVERMQHFQKKSPDNIFIFAGDVSDSTDLETFYRQCNQLWGRLDTVIANAGIALPENIADVTEASINKSIDVNFKGVSSLFKNHYSILKKMHLLFCFHLFRHSAGRGGYLVRIRCNKSRSTFINSLFCTRIRCKRY